MKRSKVSEKTLIEQDNYCQLSLLDYFEEHRPFEVVRIEARYNNRTAIKAILKKIDETPGEITFVELFNSKLAQKILEYEFGRIAEANLDLADSVYVTPEDFIKDLNVNNPEARPNQKLIALAIHELIKDTGCREIRNLIQASPMQWSRIIKTIKNLRITKRHNTAFDAMKDALSAFNPVELKHYGINPEPP